MRFIDASTFIYAFLKPKRPIPSKIIEMKKHAQDILERVNEGENVITSVVHVSEVANILEARVQLSECRRIISDIADKRSIEVVDVNKKLYATSIQTAEMRDISINDALAFVIMQERSIKEIYSFDKHFDNIPEITRVPE